MTLPATGYHVLGLTALSFTFARKPWIGTGAHTGEFAFASRWWTKRYRPLRPGLAVP